MSLILNDDEIREAKRSVSPYLADPDVHIARAQARHMARECLDWWEGEADCYNVNQRKHFEAWLRQEGVM